MLFTITQYLPIQKQDLLLQKIELTKKIKSCEPSEDETDTEDDNSPSESDFDLPCQCSIGIHQKSLSFSSRSINYSFLREPINTPPPKSAL